jgi:hypothetical protein
VLLTVAAAAVAAAALLLLLVQLTDPNVLDRSLTVTLATTFDDVSVSVGFSV